MLPSCDPAGFIHELVLEGARVGVERGGLDTELSARVSPRGNGGDDLAKNGSPFGRFQRESRGGFERSLDRCALPRSWLCAPDALWQTLLVETQRERIGRRGGKLGEAVVHLQNKNGGRKSAQRDGRVAAFQAPKRVAADEKTGRHVRSGDAALPTCEREIPAQFSERQCGGEWNG